MQNIIEDFEKNGYAVIDDFLAEDEIQSLRTACHELVEDMNPNEHKTVFSTIKITHGDDYFLTSGDKIRYFFEEGVFNEDGNLKYDKHVSLNKIGHALHVLSPEFRKVTFSDKNLARAINLKDPVIPQSMYIFKQPKFGGAVIPHQDGTYLYAEPMKVVGMWIALEDATLENGCLWFAPGSHKCGLYGNYRSVRNPEWPAKDGSSSVIYEGTKPNYDEHTWKPVPVKKGSLIVIDGLVVHKSERNTSERSRHIYTFHMVENSSKWSERNWKKVSFAQTDFVYFSLSEQLKMPHSKNVPKTPSPAINNMLSERCGKRYDNPIKEGLANFILIIFTLITKIYGYLHPNKSYASHRYWIISCSIISFALIVLVILAYQLLIWSAFLLHSILYYFAYLFCLFGAGLGVAGMVFFDKGAKASEGFDKRASEVGSSVRDHVQKFN
ncbi:DgyrCDS3487 [Dimorphilus gyrociliatus]|uniref:DgyrCDS3487 n=1 Tax=Dimorphilus gyrociliatus TaxID=2664684 RepID=A0A7I8VG23_9ANNE|nr:DgyrCDS3487 [Dimorphilus gyrociliatus]